MESRTRRPFPIIGIGASAGGLEALERFLAPVPAKCGHAFVVVQHLEPNHQTHLTSLLQRITPLPVSEITDGLVVERNHVYIIPPDRDLSILQGVLHLVERKTTRGLRLPIDSFLRALANDRREHSIGVILSGMGSDGSLGLRAIREIGGATFVQDPDESQFDGMPRSAVSAAVVDVVAPAAELHARIVSYLASGLPLRVNANPAPQGDDALPVVAEEDVATGEDGATYDGVGQVILLVRSLTGHDFSRYKRSTLTRRIERRMGVHRIAELKDYVRFLRDDPDEPGLLFAELLIGVTRFFRDPAAWRELAEIALPELLASRPTGAPLRAWVAGCSTGEEAYSLAMTFLEMMDARPGPERSTLQIFATDLDAAAIVKARLAIYPSTIAADVTAERLKRFFVTDDQGYRVKREVRESLIFAPQNLVMDPPFTKLDLIICRNLLIYLTPALHSTLLPLFHHAINPGGLLMLGSAETIGNWTDLFQQLVPRSCISRRLANTPVRRPEIPGVSPHALRTEPVPVRRSTDTRTAGSTAPPGTEMPLQRLTDRVFLERFAPIAVVVDGAGGIVFWRGATELYLDAARLVVGAALVEILEHELSPGVDAGLRRSMREEGVVEFEHTTTDEPPRRIGVTFEPLPAGDAPAGSRLVVFRDLPADVEAASGDEAQRNALAEARRQTQSTQVELQATNEELQSANEELITSKEEMQSMNEELQTVNHELQAKLDELTLASTDMSNLLNSTSIATLFLDPQLLVRRFTTPTTDIIRLIPSDVGRPITDIVSALDFPDLVQVAKEVQRTLEVFEREVSASNERWFVVRIMPYHTHDDRIDGVVLTFTDVTPAKRLEAALRDAQARMEGRLATQAAALAATAPAEKTR